MLPLDTQTDKASLQNTTTTTAAAAAAAQKLLPRHYSFQPFFSDSDTSSRKQDGCLSRRARTQTRAWEEERTRMYLWVPKQLHQEKPVLQLLLMLMLWFPSLFPLQIFAWIAIAPNWTSLLFSSKQVPIYLCAAMRTRVAWRASSPRKSQS